MVALYGSTTPACATLFTAAHPRGLLTTVGFPRSPTRDSGNLTVKPKFRGPAPDPSCPNHRVKWTAGGSVQTWPSPFGPGSPRERQFITGKRNGSRISHLPVFSMIGVLAVLYHNGTGRGKVAFLADIAIRRPLPYATNMERRTPVLLQRRSLQRRCCGEHADGNLGRECVAEQCHALQLSFLKQWR